MATLVLRNVPDDLHLKLKAAAAAHHRSMTQEAIVSLRKVLEGPPSADRPSAGEILAWLEAEVWPLLNDDKRSPDQILGYGDDGLPG